MTVAISEQALTLHRVNFFLKINLHGECAYFQAQLISYLRAQEVIDRSAGEKRLEYDYMSVREALQQVLGDNTILV